mgnify:CR=1 FL=1
MRWGIEAIVAESFAEIFSDNCTALGIPAVTLPRPDLETLTDAIEADPQLGVTVDLESSEVQHGRVSTGLEVPESVRMALVSGHWDFLGQLLETQEQVRETASRLPYLSGFHST